MSNKAISMTVGIVFLISLGITQGAAAEATAENLVHYPAPNYLPVFSDALLKEKIAEAGDTTRYPDADSILVFNYGTTLLAIGEYDHYINRRCIKILTLEGAKNYQQLVTHTRYSHDKVWYETIRILRKDGTIEHVPLDPFVEMPSPAGGILWRDQTGILALPPLEPGDALDIISHRETCWMNCMLTEEQHQALGLEHFWQYYGFFTPKSNQIVKHIRYSIRTSPELPLQIESNNGGMNISFYIENAEPTENKSTENESTENTDDPEESSDANETSTQSTFVYIIEANEITPYADGEPHQHSRWDYEPHVKITSVRNWKEKSVWYYYANYPFMEPDEALRSKVEELTAHCDTEEEIIYTLFHWVGDHIGYGGPYYPHVPEGQVGHPITQTFSDRLGVCKDIALLYAMMLRLAGIEAFTALTSINNPLTEFPDDSFNHAITIIRFPDGTYKAYDATAGAFTKVMLHQLEQEQGYIIAMEQGESMQRSSIQEYERHTLEIHADTELRSNGDAQSIFEIDVSGFPDAEIRGRLRRSPAREYIYFFEEWVKQLSPQAQLVEYCYSEPRNYGQDMNVKLVFDLPEYAIPSSNGLFFIPPTSRFPFQWSHLYNAMSFTELESRTQDLDLGANWLVAFYETVHLPRGYIFQGKDASTDLEDERTKFQFSRTYHQDTQWLELSEIIGIKRKSIPPDHYPLFREAAIQVMELTDTYYYIENETDSTISRNTINTTNTTNAN